MTKKLVLKNQSAGDILKHEFLDETNMSQNALAKALKIPANRIHAIIKGERSITADTDLRLCRFFGLTEGYFLRLQIAHDLLEAKQALGSTLKTITQYNTKKQRASHQPVRKQTNVNLKK